MNLETTWDVGVTTTANVTLMPDYAIGGLVFQLSPKDAIALARKLLKAGSRAKAIAARKAEGLAL